MVKIACLIISIAITLFGAMWLILPQWMSKIKDILLLRNSVISINEYPYSPPTTSGLPEKYGDKEIRSGYFKSE